MFYDNYGGMNLIWWIVWMGLLLWIFAIPYDIPFQRNRKTSPLDILKSRFAKGEISQDEYYDRKTIIENDLSGLN